MNVQGFFSVKQRIQTQYRQFYRKDICKFQISETSPLWFLQGLETSTHSSSLSIFFNHVCYLCHFLLLATTNMYSSVWLGKWENSIGNMSPSQCYIHLAHTVFSNCYHFWPRHVLVPCPWMLPFGAFHWLLQVEDYCHSGAPISPVLISVNGGWQRQQYCILNPSPTINTGAGKDGLRHQKSMLILQYLCQVWSLFHKIWASLMGYKSLLWKCMEQLYS